MIKNRRFMKVFIKNKYVDKMLPFFCLLSIGGIILTLVATYITNGTITPYILFNDTADTGMDFFHSIEYTRGGAPYELFRTLYPPLANAFFYLLLQFVPETQSSQWAATFGEGIATRKTNIDLRVNQSTLLLFMIFIMITVVLFVVLIQKYTSNAKGTSVLAICLLFSHGVLYTFERGNISIVVLLFCFIFLLYKDSENIYLREVSLIALAIAAGLKLYPAILGILLVYDKKYRMAIRAVIYGITSFVLPIFIFKEGVYGFSIFFEVLFKWSGKSVFNGRGLSFSKIINSIVIMISDIFSLTINEELITIISSKTNIIIFLILLVSGLFLKKGWQKVLACCLAMVIVQTQGIPMLIFLMPALLQMIREEKIINKSTIIPFMLIALTQIILPFTIKYTDVVSPYYIRYQWCLLALIMYIIGCAINEIRNIIKISTKEVQANEG